MPIRTPRVHPLLRRIGRWILAVLAYLLIWAGVVTLVAGLGIRWYWGPITTDQLITNLVSVEPDGGGGEIVWMGIWGIGVLPVVVVVLVLLVRFFLKRRRRRRGLVRSTRRRRGGIALCTALVLVVSVTGFSVFSSSIGLVDYVRASTSSYQASNYYVDPTVESTTKKRNLVTIYLESGEQTLTDTSLFEKDAFSTLEKSTSTDQGWKTIDDFQQYSGGGWTMAGITSTQCGIPLKGTLTPQESAPADRHTDLDEHMSTYMNGVNCVGDVLKKEGYKNVFLGGANSDFAAKGKFLKSHGYDEVKGLADWRAAGEAAKNFRSDWGLSDQRLMAHAKEEIDTLHAAAEKTGQPFNLSMLTLDTHEPVHVFDYCSVDTKSTVTSVYACSMDQVAGFVDYMKAKGYLEDTAVVIMGDHLKHMSATDAFHDQLDNNAHRSIFNRVWVPGESRSTKLRSGIDQLNMFPTILEAAGIELRNHAAGLGVSAFVATVPPGSAQSLSAEHYAMLLTSRSKDFYHQVWNGTKPTLD